MKKVAIGGGTGLVGSRLSDILMDMGYQVSQLSRQADQDGWLKKVNWDVANQELDPQELEGFDYIINLAGAGIADEAWTDERIKIIKESRTLSNQLLKDTIEKLDSKPKLFISASAVGYYGFSTSEKIYTEEDEPGKDLLSEICVEWEESADQISDCGVEVAKIRIGVVISDEGGALPKMEEPVRWGVGAPLGSGKQYMPWIHIDDLCNMFVHLIENELGGVYNGVSPYPVTNKEFTYTLAEVLDKHIILPKVPSFALRLFMGGRANLVLEGSRISAEKILKTGFKFTYPKIKEALLDQYMT